MPDVKPERLRSTATPPSRIAVSKSAGVMGRARVAASAPSSTALTSLRARRATSSASKLIRRRVSFGAVASRRSRGNSPLPGMLFSPMANKRCVLAMSVVRSGVA